MGTDVLPARDYLAHYQGHWNDHFMGIIYPHQKVHHYGKKSPQHPQSKKKSGHGHGSSPQKSKVKGENPEKKRPLKPKPQEESQLEVVKRGAVNSVVKGSNCKFGHGDEHALRKELLLDRVKEPAKNLVSMGQVAILKRGEALKPNNNDSNQMEIVKKKTACLVLSPTETMGPDPILATKNRTLTSRSVSLKKSKATALPSVPKLPGLKPETAERASRGRDTEIIKLSLLVQRGAAIVSPKGKVGCVIFARFYLEILMRIILMDRLQRLEVNSNLQLNEEQVEDISRISVAILVI